MDLNGGVGNDKVTSQEYVRRHVKKMNTNGSRKIEFWMRNNLYVTNPIFEQRDIHKSCRKQKGEMS